MAQAVTIHHAKTNLSKLIARVEAGEEVVIMRGKNPVARLAPMAKKKVNRRFRHAEGQNSGFPDEFFFDPLPEEELRLWEGEDEGPRSIAHALRLVGVGQAERCPSRALDDSPRTENEILVSAVVAWEWRRRSRIGKWPEALRLPQACSTSSRRTGSLP